MEPRHGVGTARYAGPVRRLTSRLLCVFRSLSSITSVFLLISSICLLTPSLTFAQEIRYLYDDLGRLVGVIDQQGNAARYVYDAVGNLLEIRRVNVADFPGPVAITFFDPNLGQVGTVVTIFGAGFSPTPGANQVAFNGIAATVTASTATSLTTTVPAGATTGPIAVTTPLGNVTSRENFTVVTPVILSPPTASVFPGGTIPFTVNTPVVWKVNDRVGGDPTIGTITLEGLYRAPTTFPSPPEVIITAVNRDDPRLQASALVTFLSVPERFTAPAVSVQVAEPRQANPLPGPPVSVQVAEPLLQASPLPAPMVGVRFAEPLVQASPLPAPLIAAAFAPVITSLSPASGAAGSASFLLTVGGEGLAGATNLQFVRNGTIDSSFTVSGVTAASDGRSLTATISIAGTASPGLRTVRVVTPAATSTILPFGTNSFTVTSP